MTSTLLPAAVEGSWPGGQSMMDWIYVLSQLISRLKVLAAALVPPTFAPPVRHSLYTLCIQGTHEFDDIGQEAQLQSR